MIIYEYSNFQAQKKVSLCRNMTREMNHDPDILLVEPHTLLQLFIHYI